MALGRVCVYSGSTPGGDPVYATAAAELGRLLAERGIGVVYGGGRAGLMGAVADAALAAGGEVIGVLPRMLDEREIGHRGLTELRVVDSMHERKAEMAALADAFVALPGGLGTLEELVEAATWTQLRIHAKPVGLLDVARYWQELEALLDHAVREGFLRPQNRGLVVRSGDPALLLDALEAWRPPPPVPLSDRADAAAGRAATLGPDADPPTADPLVAGADPLASSADPLAPAADPLVAGADIADPASEAAAGPPHPPASPIARGAPASAVVTPIPTIRPPAVGVSALVVRDGKLLLGLRRGAHGAGTWAPPGGAVDGGEQPAATALRELEEETGLRGGAAHPLTFTNDLFPADRQQWVTLHHLVAGAEGEPQNREPGRCERWEWFPLDALPSPLFPPMAALAAGPAWPPRL
jgi:uncharacterized protein (TIGR00730 family)